MEECGVTQDLRFLAAIPVESFSEGLIHLTVNWPRGR